MQLFIKTDSQFKGYYYQGWCKKLGNMAALDIQYLQFLESSGYTLLKANTGDRYMVLRRGVSSDTGAECTSQLSLCCVFVQLLGRGTGDLRRHNITDIVASNSLRSVLFCLGFGC